MTGVSEGRIASALFEGLTRFDPATLEVLPAAAESFTAGPDGLSFTFRIRPEARWSDGRPVTAEDFRWSWLRVLDPATASSYAGLLFDVAGARAFQAGEGRAEDVGITAVDERTLRVLLERRVPYFPSLCAFFTLLPVPRGAVEAHGIRWTRAENLVGNGPFRLARWSFYREIVLERSETYWDREHVGAERLRLVPVTDENTQFNLYETGGVDATFSVPSPILPRLAGRPDFVHGPRLATAFLRLNVTRPPFDRREVRTAFGFAIDRETLVRRITRGGERATGSLVPPGLPGYEPAEGLGLDAVRARAALPEGWKIGPVTLLYPEKPEYAAIATVLQHQWSEVLGADVRLVAREWKVYLSSMKRLDYDIALGQWIGDYPDPSTFLDCFQSDSGNNRTGWKNEAYDSLLRAAGLQEPGETPAEQAERRLRILRRAEDLLVRREVPILPLYHPTVRYMVSPRVAGFLPNVMGLVQLRELTLREPR